jgi:hypothetical protein
LAYGVAPPPVEGRGTNVLASFGPARAWAVSNNRINARNFMMASFMAVFGDVLVTQVYRKLSQKVTG